MLRLPIVQNHPCQIAFVLLQIGKMLIRDAFQRGIPNLLEIESPRV